MAKGPATQKSITSFFNKGKKKDDSSDVDMEPDITEDDSDDAPKNRRTTARPALADSSDLPPINEIPAMFSDLVSHIPQVKDVAEHVQGRKLRVATMCSGTESPLLALDLIRRSILDQHGVDLDVEHVFSCEIEPFKQAYIERNFHPPLLFRDVCELGNEKATTAYGSKATVPGDVDLLVAGTSCVDYSNLNNEKQDLDAHGESGRTFRGMMSWVKKHRPPIVILENVCSAPWPRIQTYFEKNGYSATYSRVDTKLYYIPHTRTRVYLLAVNEKHSKMPDTWKSWITSKLRRPASSTLDAFLLPSDDPRIYMARQKLVQEGFSGTDRRTGRTDWGRCESRHQRARLEEALGSKRPLTSWDEGGYCKLPDFAWGDWGLSQVERVWDLMDILLLRSATKGVDPSYKTQVWNLSQNVDRTITGKPGICPCLTPSMIPYITNRGGPMVGLEALSMQGLPVDELLLTRETEDNLADLAGNAMSTTVVGACILSALVVGKRLIKGGNDVESYEAKAGDDARSVHSDEADQSDDGAAKNINSTIEALVPIDDRVVGEDQLLRKPLDLSITSKRSLPDLLLHASKSARLCECEGRETMTTRVLYQCTDCGASSCQKCGGRPEHKMKLFDVTATPRLSPLTFAKELKSALPMCISLSQVTQQTLDELKDAAAVEIPEKRWKVWSEAVLRATNSELRFVEPKRQENWAVVYESPTASLELLLHPQQPEWRLHGKPKESDPANAEIRQLLELPIARLACVGGVLGGRWEFALPYSTSISITIEGVGDLVPSWEARLGLVGEEFKDRVVYDQLKIAVPDEEVDKFDRDISGVYSLLDKCGTANSALHRKIDDDHSLPPLFLLLDPHRCRDSEDGFVFSISKRRYEYGESRPVICKLDPKWRQSDYSGVKKVTCSLPCKWIQARAIKLKPSQGQGATVSVPGETLNISVSTNACRNANAILVCRVPFRSEAGPEWPREAWKEVDKVHERTIFKALAWFLEPVKHVDDTFSSWQSVQVLEEWTNCERCAPTAPALEWKKINKKDVPLENPVQAGEYERRLKRRPSPFVTQLKLDENGVGIVRLGINIPSLLHRATSRLPSEHRTERITVSWRLNANFIPMARLDRPNFVIPSNRLDPEHSQPPNFKVPLRKEQLRSLHWMLEREAPSAAPFIEEEISEAILAPLGWRAEGRAQRPVRIRGGVLADQVGYGKTAITLGLIDCTSKDVDKEFREVGRVDGKIHVEATAVIVPPHLTKQWDSECRKFAGKRFKTVVLSTATSLNSLRIEDVQEADIVIVASNLFKSSVYLENLESLSANGALPAKDGRYFNDRLRMILASLRTQTDRLQDEGSTAVMKEIRKFRREEAEAAVSAEALIATKRLKGKSYREAAEALSPKTKLANNYPKSRCNVEVVIPSRPFQQSNNVGKSTSTAQDSGDSDIDINTKTTRRTKWRAATKTPIVISEDEDEDAAVATSEYEDNEEDDDNDERNPKPKSRPKPKGPPSSASSDYEESTAEETDSDAASQGVSAGSPDEEPKVPKKTSKAKPRAKRGSGSKASSSKDETDGDGMEVDEPVTYTAGAKKSTKRKAADDQRAPKKQKRREDTDPWKLESSAVKRDWTLMQAPPLEMFNFSRVVVDEYTYLDGKAHALITSLTASRYWVLSGTPPIHDFGALKTIAAFLDIHLGVDDDAEGQSAQVKKRRREQTASEKFHSFREVHSLEWHAHRHELGQCFLNQFVRQNVAEIHEIPRTEKIVEIILPAAERAIYLELEHHLRALDMTIRRGRKTESDREKRLAKSLGESSTAEEALLKRCSHFDLEASNDNAMKACDVIVHERQKQLDECKTELLRCLREGVKREKEIGRVGDESMFQEYVRVSKTEGVGDRDASEVVIALLDEAGVAAPSKSTVTGKNKNNEVQLSSKVKDRIWEHREKTHEIRRLTKELVGRVRSLRYFTVVRDLQKQSASPPKVACPGCRRDEVPINEVAVLSSCGHMGCLECVRASAEKEECVYSVSGACNFAARVLNVVKGDTLGVDDNVRDGGGKHFGMKLEKVIDLIRNKIPKDERVLIFVQFPDLMKKLAEALMAHKIKFLEIKGSATQKSNNLEKFQNESSERVLLLNVMDESASGANLTSANHAIFLSPLLAQTKEIYDACETQAVGRLVRYGQTKHVYIWKFLTTNTIDEEIYKERTRGNLHKDSERTDDNKSH